MYFEKIIRILLKKKIVNNSIVKEEQSLNI